jgi:hypothetical protein
LGKLLGSRGKLLTIEDVEAAIAFDQPKLRVAANGRAIHVEGSYLVFENDVVAAPTGPITAFDIRIELDDRYPRHEPKVFEVGGRIQRDADHHINPDGDCCVTVWEHWLAIARDRSITGFINGPLQEYFLGQFVFERTGKWPFGERPHGTRGLEEAYADALGISSKRKGLIYHLRLLSQEWPKGHWACPCGSGKLLRHCHHDELMAMHRRIELTIAQRMLRRLKPDRQDL